MVWTVSLTKILFLKGVPKNQNLKKKLKKFFTASKHPKTHSKTFLCSTIFLFGPLHPKYQHFVALKAHISEMKAEIENVAVA